MNGLQIRREKRLQEEKAAAICGKKRRYSDEYSARAVGSFSVKTVGNVEGLFTYRCTVCNGWHLTKKPIGVAITGRDPYAENSAEIEMLKLLKKGNVTSYFNCDFGKIKDQEWIHNTLLSLESQGKVVKIKERSTSCRWRIA